MVTILDCISCKKGIIKNGKVLSCGKLCEYEFGEPRKENEFGADVYTVDKFIELIKLGTITNYDGYGYYSFDGKEEFELVPLDCNKIYKTSAQKGYKYIIWYNR